MDTSHLYLKKNEQILCHTKLHWMFFRASILLALLCIILVFFAEYIRAFNGVFVFGWSLRHIVYNVLLLLGLYNIVDAYLNYHASCYILTNKRLIICTGWLVKRTRDILLVRIEGAEISQRLLGRFFGFGMLVIYGVGSSVDILPMLPDPYAFRALVHENMQQKLAEGSIDSK